ncbi:MAG TPA: hypothetical protein VHO03_03625 [Ignavibacteriales bacterium]|nr:hypothetical protein [Ignavibacteriales bacterium]
MPSEDIIIRLRPDGSQLDAQFVKSDQDLNKLYTKAESFKEQLKQWSIVVTGFNQALELSKKIVDFVQEPLNKAAEMEVLRSTFQGSAEDIELFRKATAGTVTEAGLIKLSNQATDLGITMKDQAIFFNMAEDAADKYGGSIEENFQKIVYATEGNTKGLKQLGIEKAKYEEIVKDLAKAHGEEITKLDADTQKQIRLQAILIASGQTIDDVNAKQADSKDRLEQIAVAAEEAKVKFGEMILPVAAQLEDFLIPALKGTVDNADKIVPVIKVASVAIAAYTVSTVGLTTAQNILSISIARVKSAMETLALYAMYNPWTVAIVAAAGLAMALYELNEAYGNTIENQKKEAAAREEANRQMQQSLNTQIKQKESIQDLSREYEELNKKVESGKLSAEERQKAENRMHEILVKLKIQYPDLIKSTNDYSKELINVKSAAKNAADEIGILNGKLTEYQRAQVNNKIASGNISVNEKFQALENNFEVMGLKNEDYGGALPFYKLEEQVKNGKLSEVSKALEDTYTKYSTWATKTDSEFNLKVANDALALKNEIDRLKELYALQSSGGIVNETKGSGNQNPSGTGGNTTGGSGSKTSNNDKLDENIKDALNELNEKDQEEAVKSLEKTQAGLNMILEERNKVTLEGSEAYFKEQKRLEDLQEKKRQIWAEEKSQLDIQSMEKQVKTSSQAELNQMLLNEETTLFNVEEQMRNAKTEAELQDLERTRNTTNERINIIKGETAARKEATMQMMQAGASQYDSSKKLGDQIKEQARQNIMAIIAQAVMTYVGSIVASTGPLALVLAPAAGLAIQGLLNKLIPKFAKGGLVPGGEQLAWLNEEGPEFVVKHNAAQKYLPQLEMMNAGEDPFQNYSAAQNMIVLQAVTAMKARTDGINMAGGASGADNGLMKEIKQLNTNFARFLENPLPAVIGEQHYREAFLKTDSYYRNQQG